MRLGRILQDSIPESTDEIRQAASSITLAEDGVVAGDRTAVLRSTGRENADRDADQGYAAQR